MGITFSGARKKFQRKAEYVFATEKIIQPEYVVSLYFRQ